MGDPLDYVKRIYYINTMEQFNTFMFIIGAVILALAIGNIFSSNDDDYNHYDN
jgi:hypothetical protein